MKCIGGTQTDRAAHPRPRRVSLQLAFVLPAERLRLLSRGSLGVPVEVFHVVVLSSPRSRCAWKRGEPYK